MNASSWRPVCTSKSETQLQTKAVDLSAISDSTLSAKQVTSMLPKIALKAKHAIANIWNLFAWRLEFS